MKAIEVRMTIIMSCYNQEQYLHQAVDSVFAQKTNFAVRLVITDDNSQRDNSRAIIKEIAERHPENVVTLLNDENGRYLKNILRAKEITKTEYFTLLDADDYWTDVNYLQKAVDFLDSHSDFTIYSCNVECLEEDGTRYPFIRIRKKESNYSFNDYLKDRVVITQTTGTVFRNVIFKEGVPLMMHNAIGTDAERAFEGDYARYVMHLHYGKSHFENEMSGVYRIFSNSFWNSLSQSEKYAIGARNCFVFDKFFEGRHSEFFLWKSFGEFRKAQVALRNEILRGKYVKSANRDRLLSDVAECYSQTAPFFRDGRRTSGLMGHLLDSVVNRLTKRLSRDIRWYPRGNI